MPALKGIQDSSGEYNSVISINNLKIMKRIQAIKGIIKTNPIFHFSNQNPSKK